MMKIEKSLDNHDSEQYWKEQAEAWQDEFGKMMDIGDRLLRDIKDLQYYMINAENRGYLTGYKEGSKAGLQIAVDASNVKPAPPIIVKARESEYCDMCKDPVTGSVHYELVSGKHRCCRCMNRMEEVQSLHVSPGEVQSSNFNGPLGTAENPRPKIERQYDQGDPWTREGGIDQQ
jgi:hypothetical protein